MAHCWNHDPAKRPSFRQLVSILAGMVSDNADYLQVRIEEEPARSATRSNLSLQVNTQTIRFGNPTYLQPITLLGEESAEDKSSTPLLKQTAVEQYV